MAGQLWGVNSLGGYMYSLELSDILRTAVQPLCKFRQFCDAKDFTDKGLHKGQLFTWNVYNDVAAQGTTLVETSTLAETNFTIAQGTGTVTELGNSVPYTGFLDNLSKHPVQEIINKVLKNDAKKALDGQAWYQFNSTLLKVVAFGRFDYGHVHHLGDADYKRDCDADQFGQFHQPARQVDRRYHEGAEYPAIHGRRILRHRVADDLASDEEPARSGLPVSRRGLPDDLQRRDREV